VVERQLFEATEPACTPKTAQAILTAYAALVGLDNAKALERADSAMAAHGANLRNVARSVRTERQALSLQRNLERLYTLYTMAEGGRL
jgi:hypothetical protein